LNVSSLKGNLVMTDDEKKEGALNLFKSYFEDEEDYAAWLWKYKQLLSISIEGPCAVLLVISDYGPQSYEDKPAAILWESTDHWNVKWRDKGKPRKSSTALAEIQCRDGKKEFQLFKGRKWILVDENGNEIID
jgi:hypothetical protein